MKEAKIHLAKRIFVWLTTGLLVVSTFLPGSGFFSPASAASLTWTVSSDTMDGIPVAWVSDLAQDSSNNLYAVAGDDKVYKSTDSGANWSALDPVAIPATATLTAVIKINSRLFVGGADGGVATYYYTDDENTWRAGTWELSPPQPERIQDFFTTTDGFLLAGVSDTTNNNTIWRTETPLSDPDPVQLIHASTQPTSATAIYDFTQLSDGTLYAAGATVSDGRIWTAAAAGDVWSAEYASSATALFTVEADGNDALYAGGQDSVMLKKSGSWSSLNIANYMRQVNDIAFDPQNRVFAAGIATYPPEPVKTALVLYSLNGGNNWYEASDNPAPTDHRTKGAWAIIRDRSVEAKFYVGVGYEGDGGPTTYAGDVHIGSFASGGGGSPPPPPPDTEKPTSLIYRVEDKTDANDEQPNNDRVEASWIIRNPSTLKAWTQDLSGVKEVWLWYRQKARSDWTRYGLMDFDPDGGNGGLGSQGLKIQLEPGPAQYWKIDFQAPQQGYYEFYTQAIDAADNTEDPPTKNSDYYEANGTVDSSPPYLRLTDPKDGQTEVGTQAAITLNFSEAMDENSLQLELISTDPPGGNWSWPAGWTAKWSQPDPIQVALSHDFEFSQATTYTIKIHAQDQSGQALTDGLVPNPFSFTIAPPQDPNLSNSRKEGVVFDNQGNQKDFAGPGDTMLYSIKIINAGGGNRGLKPPKDTKIVVEDVLPTDADSTTLRFPYGLPPRSQIETTPAGFRWTINGIDANETIALTFEIDLKEMIQHNPIVNEATITYWTWQFDQPKISTIRAITPVQLEIDLSSSALTASPAFADPGEIINFTLALKNTGRTLADNLWAKNPMPQNTTLNDQGDFTYDQAQNELTWQGQLLSGETKTLTFSLKIDAKESLRGSKITDTVYLTNYDTFGNPNYSLALSAEIKIKPFFDVESTDPADGAKGVVLYKTLGITFSNNLKTNQTVDYELTAEQLGAHIPEFTLEINGKTLTFLHEDDPFSQGATYTLILNAVYDENGNVLSGFSFSFTTVAPQLVIIQPSDQTVRIAKDAPKLFQVALQDAISGQNYATEKETTLRLFSTSPTALFAEKEEGPYKARAAGEWMIKDITLAAGVGNFDFYYQDSTITPPPPEDNAEWAGVTNPLDDWYAAERKVIVEGELIIQGVSLVFIEGPYAAEQDEFSEEFVIVKRDAQGNQISFEPDERIYLATNSPTGKFYRYPIEEALLPSLPSIQAIDSNKIQVLASSGGDAESFYFKDSTVGSHKLYASPDTTFDDNDSFAVLTILSPLIEEEELLEELEEVEDETGRILERVELAPELGTTLPNGLVQFKATAYDAEGEMIENAEFAWFVVGGGGTIMKTGLPEDSSASLFTAGEELGLFNDTVLVATLYNDKLGTASASVKILDLAALAAPGTLPSTGPNGLQLILIAITLLAAVALAWVEHYEKTVLAKSQ